MIESPEEEIANYLLPDDLNKPEFWKQNIISIDAIQMVSGILFKQIFNFQKTHNRETGFLVIVTSAMAWQQIRLLSDKFKDKNNKEISDNRVLDNYCGWFEDDYQFPLYDEHKAVFGNINYVYQLVSTLRHPNQDEIKKHAFILSNEWPDPENLKILSGCKSILNIHQRFCQELSPHSGWESDIERKRKLYNNAKTKE